ncbi:phage tail tube protein [Peptostreptococcus faecalis]|uniref:phage tail tube protein n=1 Tax=Peptostreptococcus faecalis TaxID=2045015 RepID=UPI000C7B4D67|nr:phage tail tube protein [Peptostreptococcus faecalis]
MDNIKKMNQVTEAVAGSQGQAFVEIEGRRYVMASLKKFEAKFKTEIEKLGILGKSGKQPRPAGWEGTWEATLYYNQSTLRKLALQYANTGMLPSFTIQIVNDDPMSSSTIGRKSYTFLDCFFEEMTMAMLDVDSAALEEEISGSFGGIKDNEDHKDMTTA